MNFLGIGPVELVVILVVALIIFGPQKLPEIAAQAGKAIRDFRQMTSDVTGEFQRTISLDAPPPSSALEPNPAVSQETIGGATTANGASSAGATELASQTIDTALASNDVPAEEPWTPTTTELPVATKADPLAGASLLDLEPAVKVNSRSTNGHGPSEAAADTTVTYTSAPVATLAATADSAATNSEATGSADAWDAVVNTEATLPRTDEAAETTSEPAGARATATIPAAPVVDTPAPREPIDPTAEVTIREKIEAQVAAEAFRERRRIANYSRPRKKA